VHRLANDIIVLLQSSGSDLVSSLFLGTVNQFGAFELLKSEGRTKSVRMTDAKVCVCVCWSEEPD
jgi:hypothetical protein